MTATSLYPRKLTAKEIEEIRLMVYLSRFLVKVPERAK